MGKNVDEKMLEVEQKIRKLQAEQKRLKKQKVNEERKKRDHAMIVVGATLLARYPYEKRDEIINSSDEEIVTWVNSLFDK